MTTDDALLAPADVHIMFEYGAVLHAYEPFGTVTALLPSTAAPLRSLPDGTHDELTVGRDGSVTVVRRVGSVTYDGSSDESWTFINDATRYAYINIPTAAASQKNTTLLCSHAPGNTAVSIARDTVIIGSTKNATFALQNTLNISTVEAWKTWLASNNITLEYKLATPTTETPPSVTMPTVPSANLTAWVDATDGDGAAMAAGWTVDYERSLQIVIENIETAIADI